MLIRRYSSDHDGSNAQGDDRPAWVAPTVEAPVRGRVVVPGSKSLTNRELLLSALADSPSLLRAPLHSRDSALMTDALRQLGATVTPVGAHAEDLQIDPIDDVQGSVSIDCGLAGTVMRFVPPVAALATGPVSFDGDPHARLRPMRPVIEALRQLGVDIADDGRGALPFTVHGAGRVAGGHVRIDASGSSQFISALLLAAPRFDDVTVIEHVGDTLPSLPHIEMTVATLHERGVRVEHTGDTQWTVWPGPIAGRDIRLEPDLSNAAPFLAAALVTGGEVTIDGWPAHTTQVGALLPELLAAFGAESSVDGGDLTLHGTGALHGADLDLSAAGELAPTLAAVAALADSPTTLRGIAHLRGHETDRLSALESDINGLGGNVSQTADGLVIHPAELHGGGWQAFADHRMATAGAIIGLRVPGVEIDDIDSTGKTLPDFPGMWARLLRPANSTMSWSLPE